jgi:hypothetical protein
MNMPFLIGPEPLQSSVPAVTRSAALPASVELTGKNQAK